ncbi:hypothetical protein ACQVP2_06790 [Methylobacterium aquaticum]|uniref:hypothetical protein n=1 Tax=Methylobacterium aquaticum TaxID=270351 RepID=UPI003D179D2A
MTKFSAYLSIYNDWDILPHALASIKDHIDELIVVDGAYEWMDSYLRALGKDPMRSDQRVYESLEKSGIDFKIISRSWKNEIEKRMAGYDACSNRYVYRVDADEIMFFYDGAIESFLETDKAVAEMDMPLYDDPGLIHTSTDESRHPRQGFLFDTSKISADQHLHYLWLVLGNDQLPPYEKDHAAISMEPIAFNAHLSHWRTPQGSLQRCAFYQMNWMRFNGIPFLPEVKDRPLLNFDPLFEFVPAETYLRTIIRESICTATLSVSGETIRKSPLSPEQEATFVDLHRNKMEAIEQLNRDALTDWQPLITGQGLFFDVSQGCLADLIARDGKLQIRVRGTIAGIQTKAIVLSDEAPFYHHITLKPEMQENSATISISPALEGIRHRRLFISLHIHLGNNEKFGDFKITS